MYLIVDEFDGDIGVIEEVELEEDLAKSRRKTVVRWNVDTESFEELSDAGDWESIRRCEIE